MVVCVCVIQTTPAPYTEHFAMRCRLWSIAM